MHLKELLWWLLTIFTPSFRKHSLTFSSFTLYLEPMPCHPLLYVSVCRAAAKYSVPSAVASGSHVTGTFTPQISHQSEDRLSSSHSMSFFSFFEETDSYPTPPPPPTHTAIICRAYLYSWSPNQPTHSPD